MSEQQFADAVGVSRGAVQQWEKQGGTAPKRTNLATVAHVLGMSVPELVGGMSTAALGLNVRGEVPLVSEIEAIEHSLIDNFKAGGGAETFPVSVPVRRHTYALRVIGDSMVGCEGDSFPPGSIVVVEPEMEAIVGDYVIALIDPHEITFKQLVKDGGHFFLKPLNTRYPIRPLANAKVIGVVRESIRRFR